MNRNVTQGLECHADNVEVASSILAFPTNMTKFQQEQVFNYLIEYYGFSRGEDFVILENYKFYFVIENEVAIAAFIDIISTVDYHYLSITNKKGDYLVNWIIGKLKLNYNWRKFEKFYDSEV